MGHVGRLDWGEGRKARAKRGIVQHLPTHLVNVSHFAASLGPPLTSGLCPPSEGRLRKQAPCTFTPRASVTTAVTFVVLNFDDKVREESAPAKHD